jgi:drug/metabolite transporter (DMT)-like permease
MRKEPSLKEIIMDGGIGSKLKIDDVSQEDDIELAEEPVNTIASPLQLVSNPSQLLKLSTALFYGVSSILVIFTNKAVMSKYQFHFFDFLALIQFMVTTFILLLLIVTRRIDSIPMVNWQIFKEIFPVSLMFLGNVLCGLGSTKALNLPMFTALRRFSIMMTMVGEWYLLGNKPSSPVVWSIALMVLGAVIAAVYDLTFDLNGYLFILFNNIFTALNGVYMKKASISGRVSKMGVLFYNSLFSAIILMTYLLLEHGFYYYPEMLGMGEYGTSNGSHKGTTLINIVQRNNGQLSIDHPLLNKALPSSSSLPLSTLEKVYEFSHWNDPSFLLLFFLAASMGSVLNYSIFLCTTVNSALTTAVVGALKNIVTTYIGMVAFADYTFTWVNFLGINLSVLGSLYYTYMILFKGEKGFGNG